MKKHILLFISAFFFISCNDKEKKLNNEKFNKSEISDKDFLSDFKALKANQLDTSNVVAYKELVQNTSQSQKQIPQLVTNSLTNCTALPTAITQLNSGAGYEFYKFTKENSASASFMGFGGSIGKKEMLLIQDYVRYKNVECNGETKRVGIGLRCYIHVKGIKASFKGTYADIAANAQLENMSATFSLKSLGFAMQGDLLADNLAGQNDYNVDNFGKIAITFNNVLKSLSNNNTALTVSPVELPSN